MSAPHRLALPDPPRPDHSDWQVVLSDPSKRRVVLYSRGLNRLAIEPTPPPSPRAPSPSHSRPGRRSRRRRSWSGISSLVPSEAESDADESEATRAGSPLGAGVRRRPAQTTGRWASTGATEGEDEEEDPTPSSGTTRTVDARSDVRPAGVCPLCRQTLPREPASGGTTPSTIDERTSRSRRRAFPLLPPPVGFLPDPGRHDLSRANDTGRSSALQTDQNTGTSYFELLSEANSLVNSPTATRAAGARITATGGEGTPRSPAAGDEAEGTGRAESLDSQQMNEGYYARFFDEVSLLGRGGQGAVYLVRHMLNGEALGLYACKKVPVGDSTPSLVSILREVHMLESAAHPNIVAYHHAWLETVSPLQSRFAPKTPTLHILMEFANGGSLQGFIDARTGASSNPGDGAGLDAAAKLARKRRKEARERAVHLLRLEDILTLFEQVVHGLAFLHSRNILHLDLKAENVLLHWEEDALLPTCKLSDFGSASSVAYHRERTGGSGTLAYTPPEAFLRVPSTGYYPPPDRTNDMWALGLILHLLVFFALPFAEAGSEGDTQKLEEEIKRYQGFQATEPLPRAAAMRHDLPPSLLHLLSLLIHRDPSRRPSCDRVRSLIRLIRQDVARGVHAEPGIGTVVRAGSTGPVVWRPALGRVRPRRSMSDGSVGPWKMSEPGSEIETEVVEVESSDEEDRVGRLQGLGSDDGESQEEEEIVYGAQFEQHEDVQPRSLSQAGPPPSASLARALSVSPRPRVLPSPPSGARRPSPPVLALPSPVDGFANPGYPRPGDQYSSFGKSDDDSLTLDWYPRPVRVLDLMRRDARARAVVLAATAALFKLWHATTLVYRTPLEPARLETAAFVLASSQGALPLWLVALLLFETMLDISMGRPAVTLALAGAHLAIVRTVARFA